MVYYMKKCLFAIGLFLFFIFPMWTYAASIKGTSISGATEVTGGEEIALTFNIHFSGVEPGADKTLGVWFLAFELQFDDQVFSLASVSSSNFVSQAMQETNSGMYFITSVATENETSPLFCAGGSLYCSDYAVTVHFYAKDVEEMTSVIKMGEVAVALLDMNDPDKTYSEDDIIYTTAVSNQSQNIVVRKAQTVLQNAPKNIVTEGNPIIEPPKVSPKVVEPVTPVLKSDNAYLKSLVIENYEITFDRNVTDYTITVADDVNVLNLFPEVEDSKASIKVTGADDLKGNQYKVIIEVTAENGIQKYYNIVVKQKGEEKVVSKEVKTDDIEEEGNFLINKRMIRYGILALGIFFGIGIVIFIVNMISNRKLDKMLDKSL